MSMRIHCVAARRGVRLPDPGGHPSHEARLGPVAMAPVHAHRAPARPSREAHQALAQRAPRPQVAGSSPTPSGRRHARNCLALAGWEGRDMVWRAGLGVRLGRKGPAESLTGTPPIQHNSHEHPAEHSARLDGRELPDGGQPDG